MKLSGGGGGGNGDDDATAVCWSDDEKMVRVVWAPAAAETTERDKEETHD